MIRIFGLILFLPVILAHGQHQEKVDFIKAKVNVHPLIDQKRIEGTVVYAFDILESIDSVFLDARDMEITSVLLDRKKVKFKNDTKQLILFDKFKKGKSYAIKIQYSAKPKQTVYFIDGNDNDPRNDQIWTQGQGKYTSYWLPSFDDMNEKVEFDLTLTYDSNFEVIANGQLVSTKDKGRGVKDWAFDMENPMSSYLVAFAIGNYKQQVLSSTSGIAIENYHYPSDSLRVEPTFRYAKEIFDFMESQIGVPYPWQVYKQIPVKDFLYAGMENTGATIFSDGYVIDSIAFVDRNYVNVNAHELAHQWFGNLVTEVDGTQHWLHEGFATYYAYLAEKELFGDDHFYWKLYNSLLELNNAADSGEGQSLMDPKASSLIFYEKGAWALYMLHERIGDYAFKKGIKNYLLKYQFKNVTIADFLKEMGAAAGTDLSEFSREWLESTKVPMSAALENLSMRSNSLKLLFEMEAAFQNAQSDDIDFLTYWKTGISIHLKKHMLEAYFRVLPDEVIALAFETDTIPVRQVLSMTEEACKNHKLEFETLLQDESYITIENALLHLWMAYPEDRTRYLNQTSNIIGLPNKNVRLTWLTLAILTNGYDGPKTKQYFDELSSYTSPRFSSEVRQTAFQYLKEAFGFTDQNLLDLIGVTDHYSWQFRKFSRDLLDSLLGDAVYKERIEALFDKLKPEEKRYIQGKLK